MQHEMLNAVNNADKIITLGWKGSDEHFTKLLSANKNIDEVFVVSPKANTHLDSIFAAEMIKPYKSDASFFVSETPTLEGLLTSFDKS
jgi:hypothetical protein